MARLTGAQYMWRAGSETPDPNRRMTMTNKMCPALVALWHRAEAAGNDEAAVHYLCAALGL